MSHYYRFNPTVVSQGNAALCWAASLNSWLRAAVSARGAKTGTWTGPDAQANHFDGLPWTRRVLDLADMTNMWGDLANGNQSMTPQGVQAMALDVGMDGELRLPRDLTYDYLTGKLKGFGHLYLLYFSVAMYHAVVGYGVSTTDGVAVMDPAPGVGLIHRKLDFFQAANRVNRVMLIGWPK
jgi:hypothetical protein